SLERTAGRVLPGQAEGRQVAWVVRAGEFLADLAPEVVDEPEVGAAVALRVERLEVPLPEPLRVRERAVLLDVRRRRHEEDLRADLFRLQLARLELRGVLPERRALDLHEV